MSSRIRPDEGAAVIAAGQRLRSGTAGERIRAAALQLGNYQARFPIFQLVALVVVFIYGAISLPGLGSWTSIRSILVHQLLSERRFFAQFVGTDEPPVEELLPAGEKPGVQAYIDKYVGLVKRRLPQLSMIVVQPTHSRPLERIVRGQCCRPVYLQ